MSFFKREDFQGLLDFGTCAEVANKILTDRGVRVYGDQYRTHLRDIEPWAKSQGMHHTHQALLVAIEELPSMHKEKTNLLHDAYLQCEKLAAALEIEMGNCGTRTGEEALAEYEEWKKS